MEGNSRQQLSGRLLGGPLRLWLLRDALHRVEAAVDETVDAPALATHVSQCHEPLPARTRTDLNAIRGTRDSHHLTFGHLQCDAGRTGANLRRQLARRGSRGAAGFGTCREV